jgi:hypothetical protein
MSDERKKIEGAGQDAPIPAKRCAEEVLTRRDLLRKLGGLSLVAAGVLAAPGAADADDLLLMLSGVLGARRPFFLEDFESGTFTKNPWVNTPGSLAWVIQGSPNAFEGKYSAWSAPVHYQEVSKLEITLNFPRQSDLSFYYKVPGMISSLTFLIDGQSKGSFGQTSTWTKATYKVAKGTHKFTWEMHYSLNTGAGSGGLDAIRLYPDLTYNDWGNWHDSWTNSCSIDYGLWVAWMESW